MERAQFDDIDKIADKVCESFEKLYDTDTIQEVERKMAEFCKTLSERYSMSFNFQLSIFDSERRKQVLLAEQGIACFGGQEPYRITGSGATPEVYVVDGTMIKLPHDYCPKCWGQWDFKFENRECPECGAVLGRDVRVMLDTDICPHCENGKVTQSNPVCSACGYTVDTAVVVWG